MDVRHLELLRELDERGSVTAVAAATHRTPSAVSQHLRAAERAFGTPLTEPDGRGLRLTDAARVLAGAGREVAETVSRVEARWAEFRGSVTGTVSIAALPSVATFLLPEVLRALSDLPIEVRCTDLDIAEAAYAALVADYDIVIAHSLAAPPPSSTGVVVTPLAREPLDIAMAADHPLAAKPEVTAQDVVGQSWIGVPVGYPYDSVRLAVEGATGTPVVVRQRVRDNRLVEALIAGSDCVGVLPRYTAPVSDEVTLRTLVGIPTGRHAFAIMRSDRAQRRVVRRVLSELIGVGASFH